MILILDMDETIIAEAVLGPRCKQPQLALEWGDGNKGSVILRPGLSEFLEFAKENFSQVILCTFSIQDRADAFVKAAGLEDYFGGVFGRESIMEQDIQGGDPIDLPEDFLLLDDWGAATGIVIAKMALFGVNTEIPARVKKRLVGITPFQGDVQDNMLQKAMLDLKERMTNDCN